jgi:hypothetical protein
VWKILDAALTGELRYLDELVHFISGFIQPQLTTSAGMRLILSFAMIEKHLVLLWCPRLLGIVVGLFLGLFALDAFEPGKPLGRTLTDFAIHLVPAAVVLAIVALSWRRPWVGGTTFVLLAAVYALTVSFRLDWVLAISAPLLTVGLLFLWSWRHHQQLDAS